MKKLKVISYLIVGGILGFGIHVVRHSLSGVDLSSSGPHIIEGVLFTLTGIIMSGTIQFVWKWAEFKR